MPTPAEVREALAAAEQEDLVFGLFLRLCATTGLRTGEVCALRWCDLDLEAHAGRLRSEAAFAALAGASPIPASSGQVTGIG